MNNYLLSDAQLTNIADAIRYQLGSKSLRMTISDMANYIYWLGKGKYNDISEISMYYFTNTNFNFLDNNKLFFIDNPIQRPYTIGNKISIGEDYANSASYMANIFNQESDKYYEGILAGGSNVNDITLDLSYYRLNGTMGSSFGDMWPFWGETYSNAQQYMNDKYYVMPNYSAQYLWITRPEIIGSDIELFQYLNNNLNNKITSIAGMYHGQSKLEEPTIKSDSIIDMSFAFGGCYLIKNAYIGSNTNYYFLAYKNCNVLSINCQSSNLYYLGSLVGFNGYWAGNRLNYPFDFANIIFNNERIINMRRAFSIIREDLFSYYYPALQLYNIVPLKADNAIDMYMAYYNANFNTSVEELYCGDNTVNFSCAYYGCNLTTAAPKCGNNVVNMYAAFYGCSNITGNPVCGTNVINMVSAYSVCCNLTGEPSCSDSVINFSNAYRSCSNITGNGVCGNNVTNMDSAYSYCNNLTGDAQCGPRVISMEGAYYNCFRLSGSPYMGESVVYAKDAFYNCTNLTGNPACSPKLLDFSNMYTGCNKLNGVPVCGDSAINMAYTYYSCSNLTGSPSCGNNVINMISAYAYCHNLIGSPVCGSNVIDMTNAYYYCNNLTGDAACGDNVKYMQSTYMMCHNLTGAAACGDNVTSMIWTYDMCYRMQGPAACGNNVISMFRAYNNCTNLQGPPAIGPKVKSLQYAYCNCQSISGTAVIPNTVNNMLGAFVECYNLSSVEINTNNLTGNSLINAFSGISNLGGNILLYNASCNYDGADGLFCSSTTTPIRNSQSSLLNIGIVDFSTGWGKYFYQDYSRYLGYSSNPQWETIDNGYYSSVYNIKLFTLPTKLSSIEFNFTNINDGTGDISKDNALNLGSKIILNYITDTGASCPEEYKTVTYECEGKAVIDSLGNIIFNSDIENGDIITIAIKSPYINDTFATLKISDLSYNIETATSSSTIYKTYIIDNTLFEDYSSKNKYKSQSTYHALGKITFKGYKKFVIYIYNNQVSGYKGNYMRASQLDATNYVNAYSALTFNNIPLRVEFTIKEDEIQNSHFVNLWYYMGNRTSSYRYDYGGFWIAEDECE